jgi:hypothetical protein
MAQIGDIITAIIKERFIVYSLQNTTPAPPKKRTVETINDLQKFYSPQGRLTTHCP